MELSERSDGRKSGKALEEATPSYIARLQPLPKNATFAEYASLRASLLWASRVRPCIGAFVSLIGADNSADFSRDGKSRVEAINDEVQWLRDTADVVLTFPSLDRNSLSLLAYADASHQSRKDRPS